jgi:hypothetical protein
LISHHGGNAGAAGSVENVIAAEIGRSAYAPRRAVDRRGVPAGPGFRSRPAPPFCVLLAFVGQIRISHRVEQLSNGDCVRSRTGGFHRRQPGTQAARRVRRRDQTGAARRCRKLSMPWASDWKSSLFLSARPVSRRRRACWRCWRRATKARFSPGGELARQGAQNEMLEGPQQLDMVEKAPLAGGVPA